MCLNNQIVKVSHAYFIKNKNCIFILFEKKIRKKGIITSLYLSTRIWLQKFQKQTQN